MSNIKNIYIKAPKKTVNNKNLKLVVKKNSLKKINNIKEEFQISNKPIEEIKILPSKITRKIVGIRKIVLNNLFSNSFNIKFCQNSF